MRAAAIMEARAAMSLPSATARRRALPIMAIAEVGMRAWAVGYGDDKPMPGTIMEVTDRGCWVKVDSFNTDDAADDGSVPFPWRNLAIIPQQSVA